MARALFFLAIILFSCNTKEENGDFVKGKTNFRYRIIPSEKGDSIRFGDIVKIHLKQFIDDSLMNDTRQSVPVYVKIDKQLRDFDFSTIVPQMKVGDSAITIFPTREIIERSSATHPPHFLEDGENIKVYFKIIARFSDENLATKDFEFENHLADSLKKQIDEKGLTQAAESFDSLVKTLPANYERTSNGVIIQRIGKSTGIKIKKGDSVAVVYKGMLMNGTVFEETTKRNPFIIKAGIGDAVAGFDSAIARLSFQDKARIFIPAKQAYAQNKQGGKIPAYSNLVFEVEVLQPEKK